MSVDNITEQFKQIFLQISQINNWDENSLNKILRKYNNIRNDELVKAYNQMVNDKTIEDDKRIRNRIRLRPTRTNSGVAVVTVMTKPYACPGKCIYCPTEKNMPKSYISSEPGAQRALSLKFDPYAQVFNRLIALKNIGHNIEKVELIILGGTWSAYPRDYQLSFINQCYTALNDISPNTTGYITPKDTIPGNTTWAVLKRNQEHNENAYCRNVGLVLETRPDCITEEEVTHMRKLGATKVQLGIQTINNKILQMNGIGRTDEDTQEAFKLLRLAGFKIHGHWMPNLYGSDVDTDIESYKKLWGEEYSPDELKIYPTSVIENTPLYNLYKEGTYKPYTEEELTEVLYNCMINTPRYCRLSRIIRDIPSTEIIAGNKKTNLRQIVEQKIFENNIKLQDIRSREIKEKEVLLEDLETECIKYVTKTSTEYFLSYKTKGDDKICGFLRLSIPYNEYQDSNFIEEIRNSSTVREVHVYGKVVGVNKRGEGESQHLGLGKRLLKWAEDITKREGLKKISVISAIGTREYYKSIGYSKGDLYMSKQI